MANRKEVRFIQRERMKKAGYRRICDPRNYDGVNDCHRSFFAMHWRNFPNLREIPILRRKRTRRKEAFAR